MTTFRYSKRGGSSLFNPNRSLVSDSLASKVLGEDYAHKRVVRKKTFFDRRFESVHTAKMTDDNAVLEARRLYEQCGKRVVDIHEILTAHGYDVTAPTIRSWVMYLNRPRLIPDKNAASYLQNKAMTCLQSGILGLQSTSIA